MFPWIFSGLMMMMNSFMGRSTSMENMEKQQEFQAAMQARNWEHTAKMQAEMQERQFREAREAAKRTAELQRSTFEEQTFLASWPLLDPPAYLRRDFRTALEHGTPLPLQIIIPTDVSALAVGRSNLSNTIPAAMRDLATFVSAHYAHCAGNMAAAKIYTNCTKSPQQGYGTSQLNAIYEVFHLAPTLVLNPYCKGNEFCINCSYWDGSDTGKQWTPSFLGPIFSCNISALQRSFLQEKAAKWEAVKESIGATNKAMETLAAFLEKEGQARQKALANGVGEEQIEEFLSPVFADEYKKACDAYAGEIGIYVSKMICAMCRLSVSLLTDMHYLLHEGLEPKFPKLCDAEMREFPVIAEQADELFSKALEYPSHEHPSQRTKIPLWHAKLAVSYKGTGLDGFSGRHVHEGLRNLKRLLPAPEADPFWPVVGEIEQTVTSLRGLPEMEDDPYIRSCIKVLRADSRTLQQQGNDAYRAGNKHEAFGFWLRASQQNHPPAYFAVGQAYEAGLGVSRDEGRAAYYYRKAIECGFDKAGKKAHLVADACRYQGDWMNAMHFWSMGAACPDNPEKTVDLVQAAAFLLTDEAGEAASADITLWQQCASSYTGMPGVHTATETALATLQTAADEGDIHALDFLGVVYLRMRGRDIPLFEGSPCGDICGISPVSMTPELEDYLVDIIRKCLENHTPRSGEMQGHIQAMINA